MNIFSNIFKAKLFLPLNVPTKKFSSGFVCTQKHSLFSHSLLSRHSYIPQISLLHYMKYNGEYRTDLNVLKYVLKEGDFFKIFSTLLFLKFYSNFWKNSNFITN
jgi:hypothetical protein